MIFVVELSDKITYDVHKISFQTFFVWAFKIVQILENSVRYCNTFSEIYIYFLYIYIYIYIYIYTVIVKKIILYIYIYIYMWGIQ